MHTQRRNNNYFSGTRPGPKWRVFAYWTKLVHQNVSCSYKRVSLYVLIPLIKATLLNNDEAKRLLLLEVEHFKVQVLHIILEGRM